MAEEKKALEAKEEKVFATRPAIVKDYSIIKHRIVTEETQRLQKEDNSLVFAVEKTASKPEIKAAIQAIFSAKVKSVNTRNLQRKTRRVGRYEGYLPQYKKAIVRFDSSFDLGKITAAVATEEQQANKADEK